MSLLTERASSDSVNFGIGEPTHPTPQRLVEAAMKIVALDSADYGPVAGLASFRATVAERYQDTTFAPTGVDNVLATCGVTQAIHIALAALLERGGEVIYPDPGFVLYEPAIKLCGGVPVPWRLNRAAGFSWDSDDLDRLITDRTRAVIVNSPSNPTGTVIPARELEKIARICRDRSVPVISDEIYEKYVYHDRHYCMAEFTDDVIVCSGVSKLFRLAGWRLGWCFAAPEMISRLMVHHQYSVFRAPTVAQRIAQLALGMDDEIAQMVQESRSRRDLMVELLREVPGVRVLSPQGTFFVYADVRELGSDWSVALKFLENGVTTVPSTGPGAGFGDNGSGFIRLSYSCDIVSIASGVRRIREVAERCQGGSGR